ncbi:MAG: hypothetical protein EXQ98_04830 [Alphaproteobacteria bacterium]|nr:hypothetical protein [Alphaproteobacteria bacterium]
MNEQMRFVPYLKVAVIVMGVMILVGLLGLGYMLYNKSQKREAAEEANAGGAPASSESGGMSAQSTRSQRLVSLGLPPGSRVGEMTATDDRLVLNVRVPGQGERIVILDLRKGGVIGHVALENATP